MIVDSEKGYSAYVEHLYISLAKLTASQVLGAKPKSTEDLRKEFRQFESVQEAIPVITNWVELQIVDTETRHDRLLRDNKQGNVPTHIGVLLGAWKFIRTVVKTEAFYTLKLIWGLLTAFRIPENARNQCTWHLGAILCHWIDQGVANGLIPVIDTSGGEKAVVERSYGSLMRHISRHLHSLGCFLNFTATEGQAFLRNLMKNLPEHKKRPLFLLRLSATEPGVIVLQFLLPVARFPAVNVRISPFTMEKSYMGFFMSSLVYTDMCRSYISAFVRREAQRNTDSERRAQPIRPTLDQMIGLTNAYTCYFEVDEHLEPIPLSQ